MAIQAQEQRYVYDLPCVPVSVQKSRGEGMTEDIKPVTWSGMASFDCNDDPLLCPTALKYYYPNPTHGRPQTMWESREEEMRERHWARTQGRTSKLMDDRWEI